MFLEKNYKIFILNDLIDYFESSYIRKNYRDKIRNDEEFVFSCYKFFCQNKHITDKQFDVLKKIYDKNEVKNFISQDFDRNEEHSTY